MKLLKGALLTGILISGFSYSAPYELENPLNPAWYKIVGASPAPMCKVDEKAPYELDRSIQAEEAVVPHEYIMFEEMHQH